MKLSRRALLTPLLLSFFAAGCFNVLGIDEFEDAPSGTDSGKGGNGNTGGNSGGSSTGGGGSISCTPASTQACYSGPAGTAGVAACKEGTQTCNADGDGYSSCEGEVTPLAEDCNTPGDEDCDGKVCSDALWSMLCDTTQFEDYDIIKAIVRDKSGNTYIAGSMFGGYTLTCGGKSLSHISGNDFAFVVKLDKDGKATWQRAYPGMSDIKLSVDSLGRLFLAGNFSSSAEVEGTTYMATTAGVTDIIVAAYRADGVKMWVHHYGSTTNTRVEAMAAASSAGGLVLGGRFQGSVSFASGPSITAQNDWDGFAVKLALNNGKQLWTQRLGDKQLNSAARQDESVTALAIDSGGNVLAGGTFTEQVVVPGANSHNVLGTQDVFIARLKSSDGIGTFSRAFGSIGSDYSRGIAVDNLGGPVLVGAMSGGGINFGGGLVPTNSNSKDGFVVKLDVTGNHQWSRAFGGASTGDALNDVAIDKHNNVIVAGRFQDSLTIGSDTFVSSGYSNVFLSKLIPSGDPLWSKAFGDDALQFKSYVGVAPDDDVIAFGFTNQGVVDLGTGPLKPSAYVSSSKTSDSAVLGLFNP